MLWRIDMVFFITTKGFLPYFIIVYIHISFLMDGAKKGQRGKKSGITKVIYNFFVFSVKKRKK